MKAYKHLLPLAVLLSLAACGDDAIGPDVDVGDLRGTMSFSYQGGGAQAGNFQASGAAPTNASLGDWAGGIRTGSGPDASIGVTGTTRSGNDYDMTTLVLDGTTAGRYSFDENCDTSCAYGAVVFDLATQGDEISRVCNLTSGTLQLTSVSSTEAKGTFSGTGVCVSSGALVDEEFRVTGGEFNVKLAGQVPG